MTLSQSLNLERAMNRTRASVVYVLVCACGGPPATQATPTTVVGTWDLASVDFTQGQHSPATGILSFQLASDKTMSLVSCMNPSYSGENMICAEQRVCATGTYTFDGTTLSLTQTGRTDSKTGQVAFSPGTLIVKGPGLFGSNVAASNFHPMQALPTDCIHLP